MQIVWQGAITFEYIWMLTTSFFLDKLQISYFLASNSTTKGIGNIYMHAYIYVFDGIVTLIP